MSSTTISNQTLEKLLDQLLVDPSNVLDAKQFEHVMEGCLALLSKEESVLSISGNVSIIGDLHGCMDSLNQVIERGGQKLTQGNYLFLGDYVDRGEHSVALLQSVLIAKLMRPEAVWLLRGNHECKEVSKVYGYLEDMKSHYESKLDADQFQSVLNLSHKLFNALPFAAVVDDHIFCVHGGLSETLESIESIKKLERFKDVPHEGGVTDLLWSDPGKEAKQQTSPRGAGHLWGTDFTKSFMTNNKLSCVIRSHQLVTNGYEWTHEGQVLTIFSAANYCGKCNNTGAFVRYEQEKKKLRVIAYSQLYQLPVNSEQLPTTTL
eukprot:CAMPEP_0201548532 /NCGR_PEP_ID=MMETSP0173_2-20130828/5085_1 /ASSEMBLY_ACC=CAM_ASM_000268 /TAXON_ID=218659 /ORGANISM="Vexillifera sp., Strain DIVA3 564/2" /LENGTH=319 /DNA_ID=CAMNT_0047957953 /DNA_START=88 /DNA_END=1047 /DNA_ORIENTATION=-